MRKYRAEQIIKWHEIKYPRFRGGGRRKIYKYLWKNRGELIFGKDKDYSIFE